MRLFILIKYIGFNKKRVDEQERLFNVHYHIQNGEECESTEELTYAQVHQGRTWYKVYHKDKQQKAKKMMSLRKNEEKVTSQEAYASLMEAAAEEIENFEADIIDEEYNNHLEHTPAHNSSRSSSCSSSSNNFSTGVRVTTDTHPLKRLHHLTIDEVSSLMTSINMPDELITAFVQQKVDGSTLAMIDDIEELKADYLQYLGMKNAKIKTLWAHLLKSKTTDFA